MVKFATLLGDRSGGIMHGVNGTKKSFRKTLELSLDY